MLVHRRRSAGHTADPAITVRPVAGTLAGSGKQASGPARWRDVPARKKLSPPGDDEAVGSFRHQTPASLRQQRIGTGHQAVTHSRFHRPSQGPGGAAFDQSLGHARRSSVAPFSVWGLADKSVCRVAAASAADGHRPVTAPAQPSRRADPACRRAFGTGRVRHGNAAWPSPSSSQPLTSTDEFGLFTT